MLIPVAGFLAVTALFLLLVVREISRVSATSVGGPHGPSLWAGPLFRRAELLLWVASAALMAPRLISLLT